MRESLKIAKHKLIQRWVSAFKEVEKFNFFAAQTRSFKYADIFSYNLLSFINGNVKPGSKLFDAPPADEISYGKYGFNEQGVLTTSEIYTNGKLNNFGFFTKSNDLIEYIEFSKERNVPSSIQRIVFKDGKKNLFQSVFANGRNGFRTTGTNDLTNQITKAFEDGYSAICTIEIYEYEKEIITQAHGLTILPGLGEDFYENKYYYKGNKLTEIQRYNLNGENSIVYIAPAGKSLTALSDELAAMVCDHLIAILKKQVFDSPLFIVELSYRYCDNYFPHPVVITENQKNEAISRNKEYLLTEGQFIYSTDGLTKDIEKKYVEFYQLMERKDNWEAGRKMLIKIAKLLMAGKLKNEIPITNDFVVFPIEWELEWQELEQILLKCGIDKDIIKGLKKHGWVH